MKTRIVPSSELSSRTLRAKDYVGGPEEPDASAEEAYQHRADSAAYKWDASDLTACCRVGVFVSDDPDDGSVPQCPSCGAQYPKLLGSEPTDPAEPGDSCVPKAGR